MSERTSSAKEEVGCTNLQQLKCATSFQVKKYFLATRTDGKSSSGSLLGKSSSFDDR